jgi:hypothetical protein
VPEELLNPCQQIDPLPFLVPGDVSDFGISVICTSK